MHADSEAIRNVVKVAQLQNLVQRGVLAREGFELSIVSYPASNCKSDHDLLASFCPNNVEILT
jgi:hypothetical protein